MIYLNKDDYEFMQKLENTVKEGGGGEYDVYQAILDHAKVMGIYDETIDKDEYINKLMRAHLNGYSLNLKKFYMKLPNTPCLELKDELGDSGALTEMYINYDIIEDKYMINSNHETERYKTQFTFEETLHIESKLHHLFNFDNFTLVPVEKEDEE